MRAIFPRAVMTIFVLLTGLVSPVFAANLINDINVEALANDGKCWPGQSDFCGCMQANMWAGCKRSGYPDNAGGKAKCLNDVTSMYNRLGGVNLCHAQHVGDLNNCIMDLDCFFKGATDDNNYKCAEHC